LDFKDGSRWFTIQAKKASVKQYNVSLNINDSLIVQGKVNYKTNGYHALPIKNSYYSSPDEHLKSYKNKFSDAEILNYKIDSEQKNSFSFDENFDIRLSTELVGGNVYFNPFLFKFFDTNPFKLQERTYPIDFGFKESYLYSLKFNVGEKFEIVNIPEEVLYKLPNNTGQVILKSLKKGNTIRVYFKFDFKKAIYNSSYYKFLKEYMSTVINIQSNSLIVLKKK